ncbi:MAG: LL-diaminopimelate aminotransferase [Clostridia bacterium]|nr:LL-diaminopimelate aminotransferase [Clostridia bacterium]
MLKANRHYLELKDSYLFHGIKLKVNAYLKEHPNAEILRLGIGDVTRPLCPAAVEALERAARDQGTFDRFHGYMPECGDPALREAIAKHYEKFGVKIDPEEAFVSSGASDELGDILSLFDPASPALIMEPAYPAYVDASVIMGRRVIHLAGNLENGFLPLPGLDMEADLIYLCSPNNPTGATYDKAGLKAWVDYANERGAVILFDAAYEAFIRDDLPHSIFQIPGARTCAIEICSLSKTAGFTGTRLGYTVIPKELERDGVNFNRAWVRDRTTRTNGVSYILQQGGLAVFSPEGQKQLEDNLSVYRENARVLKEALNGAGLWTCGGQNAPYVWAECPEGVDSWRFFDILLKDYQIVATPGAGFGESGEGYIRFSSFASPEAVREAARRLAKLAKG